MPAVNVSPIVPLSPWEREALHATSAAAKTTWRAGLEAYMYGVCISQIRRLKTRLHKAIADEARGTNQESKEARGKQQTC